ncbi:MAG: cytochrome c [Gammaproteobacteria bacterium]|nr:cytochrome c [Pseudomonadales bacterium]MCP5348078.1 cytochrome c [Pseudomonadales bacterium]
MRVKTLLAIPALLVPFAALGQAHNAVLAEHQPHYYDVQDWGIDPASVTFADHIAPILQRSCQNCHRPGGGGPMSLQTYDEVRPWAPVIMYKTAIRDRMGAMPPFYVEKDIGIDGFKDDYSLSDLELAMIQAWANNGAPRGNPANEPDPLVFDDSTDWTLGSPDLVLRGPDMTRPAVGPDWWGDLGLVPTGLTEDRYVKSVEVREVNDIPVADDTKTVGGRYIFHHMTYTSGVLNEDGTAVDPETRESWPIHEVGRNADIFSEKAGRLLQANSALHLEAAHLHANGRETTGHLEFGITFFPRGYEPEYTTRGPRTGNGIDLDIVPNRAGQEVHNYVVLSEHTKIMAFEPHLHAPGVRMCMEAIWGHNIFTLNCVGYDHNWVKQYVYDDDKAPLLPKGTILHTIAYMDTTANNPNLADPRNWSGAGRRSVTNMFIDLGYSVTLTEEQFQAEMAARRALMTDRNDYDIGCPLCWAPETVSSTVAQGIE